MVKMKIYDEITKIAANEWISTKSNGKNYTFRNSTESHKIMQRKDLDEAGKIKLLTKGNLMKKADNDTASTKDWEETFNALKGEKQKQASGSSYQALLKIIDGDK